MLIMHRVVCVVFAAAITSTHAFQANSASSFTRPRSGEATTQVNSSQRGRSLPRTQTLLLAAEPSILLPFCRWYILGYNVRCRFLTRPLSMY